jgi:hypothetical protein
MTERGAGNDLGWGIYKVFPTADERHVFIGVTSDSQWQAFCNEFGWDDLWAEPGLRNNAGRRAGASDAARRPGRLFVPDPATPDRVRERGSKVTLRSAEAWSA